MITIMVFSHLHLSKFLNILNKKASMTKHSLINFLITMNLRTGKLASQK